MIHAYFDTNVFGDLRTHDKGVTAQIEAIRSFARGGDGATRVFFRKASGPGMRSGLRSLLLGDEMSDLIDRKIVVEECKQQKQDFRDMLRAMRRGARDQVRQLREGGFIPDFHWVFDQRAEKFAEYLAQRAGCLDACQRRGLSGLLKIPVIQMAIGASISLAFATSFEQRPARPGDSRDMLHATLAAATAHVFVTHDEELGDRILSRVGVPGLRLASLHELLEWVRKRSAS